MGVKSNVDMAELARFNTAAKSWWDVNGPYAALHDINPLRCGYVADRTQLAGRRVIDVGCGGGLISEAMAKKNAVVTGIDLSENALSIARKHAVQSGLDIDYRCVSAERMAADSPGRFDVVVCMELIEHVPDPAALIAACGRLARAGGDIFLATLNRTFASYLLAIVAAEHLLRIVAVGTHRWDRFIRPAQVGNWAGQNEMTVENVTGFCYIPFIRKSFLVRSPAVNYLMHLKRKSP